MDTTKKIIDSIIFELSGFNISDEKDMPDESYVLDKLNHYRSVSIRDMKVIPESMYTESYCNEIKCEGRSCVINGRRFVSPFKLFYVELGSILDNVGWKNIRYFGLDSYRLNFKRKSLTSFSGQGNPEYTLGIPSYTIVGNYALIQGLENYEDLRIIWCSALFSSPQLICGQGLDVPYPCPDDILARAIRLTKMDILHGLGIQPEFLNDNKKDNITTNQNEPQREG